MPRINILVKRVAPYVLLGGLAAAAFALVAPSVRIYNGGVTFAAAPYNDTVTYKRDIEPNATYTHEGYVPAFEIEFFDANNALVSSPTPNYIPAEFLATCSATSTQYETPFSFNFDGIAYMKNTYNAQPAKIKPRIAKGHYRYTFNRTISTSGCGTNAMADFYRTPWSPMITLP